MKKVKKFWKKLMNCGFKEDVFVDFREEIIAQNGKNVLSTSFIGSLIMTILTVAAIFIPSVSKVLPLYLATAICFIVIYIVSRMAGKKNGSITLICNYAFLTTAFFFAVGLDVIQKSVTATTVCVLLVALPLLVVDKPYREFIFFLIVSVCFMLESVYIKQSPKASIDVLNALSFFFVGAFLGYKHNQMVLRNIRGHYLLAKQRDMDTLTELYNKGALELRAQNFLSGKDVTASIIVIDMDNFKFVNDTYGHHAGDELLASIGKLLFSLFRNEDLISRFGGDEFVVFLPFIEDRNLLRTRAEQILSGVERIRISADAEYRAHICMGIATFPQDGSDYEELFKSADAAMYEVKQNGKNGYGFFGKSVQKKILVVDDIEMDRSILKKTLGNDYEMFEASDGADALGVLEKNEDITLVITDIQMPNMDGEELIRSIRCNPEWDHISIIANTQYGDVKKEDEVFRLGVDDFIYKSVSPRIIQRRVKNVLKATEDR